MSRTSDRVKKLFRGLAGGAKSSRAQPVPVCSDSSLRVGVASHMGPRPHNEDYVAMSQRGDFFAVSDGIGGAPFGDVMSRIACNAAVQAFDDGANVLEAFATANELASVVSELLGERSGATLLLAERVGRQMDIVSAGDTRAYLLRLGVLELITDAGRAHSYSNALNKAVGYGEIEPDEVTLLLEEGDWLLLCTDGVWEYLSEQRLSELLTSGGNAPMVAEEIAWEASRVGQDNSTCACMYVDTFDDSSTGTPLLPADLNPYGPNTPDAEFLT